jgi:diguanylate cyclase (GGDEF)-like protein/PAS domain S-box-containing protein
MPRQPGSGRYSDPLPSSTAAFFDDDAAHRALLGAIRRARAQLDAIGTISRADALLSGDVEGAARLVTECAARVSGCERVNVWLFDESETELHCIDAYEASSGTHTAGMVLHEAQYAAEFRTIKESGYVDADDPLTDPRTAGYVEAYLKPLRITSMLDAVIHASGRNFGLLCFEHVDRPHHWEQDEIAFACQLADKLALAIVNHARRAAEATLRESEEKYRRLVESTTDSIWEVDASGTLTYVSPRMADLLGCAAGQPMDTSLWATLGGRAPGDEPPAGPPRAFTIAESAVTTADGRRVVLESSATPVFDVAGGFAGYRGISRDVTQRNEATRALRYRDTVLHAVMTSAAELVAGSTLDVSLPRALAIVGRAIGVDRVLVFRLAGEGGAPSLAHAWRARGARDSEPEIGMPAAADFQTCLATAVDGGAVVTCGGDERVIGLMRAMGSQSVAVVPVAVHGVRWGCIVVDDRTRQREWTATETDSLRTLAEVVGALLAREAAEAALRRSELTFRTVAEAAQDGILMFDAAGTVQFWNPAAGRILGYSRAEAMGRRLEEWLVTPPVPEAGFAGTGLTAPMASADGGQTMELAAVRRDGVEIPIELSVAPVELGERRVAVGILRDISDRKRAEAEMQRMARYDGLTGLANRGHFVEAVEHAIARSRRDRTMFAVLYLDIDHFKDVNDTLGHPVGDRLLQAIAGRLRSRVRETDTIARFGGDEFAILQTTLQDATDAARLAGTLLDLLTQPFHIDGNEIRTAASVGITTGDAADRDVEALLAHADIALYRAKSEGRGTFRFFTDAMDAEVRTRVTLAAELRRALGGGELFLLYQPQVDLETGRVVGVEALLRWRHPRRGVLGPAEFLGAAESSGFIVALGQWVLAEVCRQGREWIDAGVAPDVVAVNVSPLQFRAPLELERCITLAVADSGLPPERLELELTETALMEATRDHSAVLGRLRGRGIRLSIDDFGTGYSSLDYLRRFPADRIKIAQSFVSGMTRYPENAAIVKAALGLTRELGLGVIAEGVECAEERDLLREWGCPQAQGNLFAEPLAVEAVRLVLQQGLIDHAAR